MGLFKRNRSDDDPPDAREQPRPQSSEQGAPGVERRSEQQSHPSGAPSSAEPLAFDMDRLKDLPSSDYEPLLERLSFIQVRRGRQESLLIVRRRDLGSLAALTGLPAESFVEKFQDLGVLVSMN